MIVGVITAALPMPGCASHHIAPYRWSVGPMSISRLIKVEMPDGDLIHLQGIDPRLPPQVRPRQRLGRDCAGWARQG